MKDETTMEELFDEIEQVRQDAAAFLTRQRRNLDTRFCQWPGKSNDGRKHREQLGEEPFPWEGASDTEVRLVDMLINENVKAMRAAFFRAKHGKLKEGVRASDIEFAGKLSTVVKWLLFTQMELELRREVELAAQWQETHGCAAMGIFWNEETALEMRDISVAALEEMAAAAREADDGVASTLENLLIEIYAGNADAATDLARELMPELTRRQARKAVRQLIQTGEAQYPFPHVVNARPQWRAYKVYDDIFFPSTTETFEGRKPRFIATREWLSEEELRNLAQVEEWDAEWVEKAVETKGQSAIDLHQSTYFQRLGRTGFEQSVEDFRELIEVWRVWRRKADEDGTAGIYTSVLHPSVPGMLAKEETLLDYRHGEYPFVELRREMPDRSIIESRGIPELARTAQQEIKTQRDSRVDYTNLTTLPPAEAPVTMAKFNLRFRPGQVNFTRTQGSLRFMDVPRPPTASIEIEQAIRNDVNEYFGRLADGVAPARSLLFTQDLVDTWLLSMRQCLRHTVALMRQFMPEEEAMRITGPMPEGHQWAADRLEIQGQYDFRLSFDARDLDPEHVLMKMKLINEMVVPGDVTGSVDRAGLTRWQMQAIDPNLAEDLLRPMEAVTEAEIEEEKAAMNQMWAGIEPAPVAESGMNYQLRLQVLQNQLQMNPEWAERYEREREGVFGRLLDARQQQLTFRLQQEQNKQIGRIGAMPVLGG